eukprot:m.160666 g.160666  ORF g.160666 m.160666 type:complete len:706 (-) comp31194_c0_seq1:318-2435(-)
MAEVARTNELRLPGLRRTRSASSTQPRPLTLKFSETLKLDSATTTSELPVRRRSMSAIPFKRQTSAKCLLSKYTSPYVFPMRKSLSRQDMTQRLSMTSPAILEQVSKEIDSTFAKVMGDPRVAATERRARTQAYQKWMDATTENLKKEAAQRKKKQKEQAEFIHKLMEEKDAQNEVELDRWERRKEDEENDRLGRNKQKHLDAVLNKPYTLSEVEAALGKVVHDDNEFEIVKDYFVEAARVSRKISRETFEKWILLAMIDIKFAAKLAERLDEEMHSKGVKKPLLASFKVGKLMLDAMQKKRSVFGEILTNFRSVFDTIARHDGTIDREDMKQVLDRLDIVLSPAQANDFFKHIDGDNSNEIQYDELETFFIDTEVATCDPKEKKKRPALVDTVLGVLARLEEQTEENMDQFANANHLSNAESWDCESLLSLVESSCGQIDEDRRSEAFDNPTGVIGFLDFRGGLRELEPVLSDKFPHNKRITFNKLMERVFKVLDKDKEHKIKFSNLQMFIRQLNIRMQKEQTRIRRDNKRRLGQTTDGHVQALLLRIGKVMLSNMKANSRKRLFGHVVATIDDLFNAIDTDGSGEITKQELRHGLRRLDCGLSATQETELLQHIDADGNGSIDLKEFREFLDEARIALEVLEKQKESKANEQLALMDEFMSQVCNDPDVMTPLYMTVIKTFQIFECGAAQAPTPTRERGGCSK